MASDLSGNGGADTNLGPAAANYLTKYSGTGLYPGMTPSE